MAGVKGRSGGKRPGSGPKTKQFTLKVGDVFLLKRDHALMELWRVEQMDRKTMTLGRIDKVDGPALEQMILAR